MTIARYRTQPWFRAVVFMFFLACANLTAGYFAIKLDYPSLYNVNASFSEYAIPLPFNWALAHIPSMVIFGVPLLFLHSWKPKSVQYFRFVCLFSFLALLLELDRKIPFFLFPKVDALFALIFSIIILPPNKKENPVLWKALQVAGLSLLIGASFYAYSSWKHRTPQMAKTQYMEGTFLLQSIVVNNDFRKNMIFEVNLKRSVTEEQVCSLGQTLAAEILKDYPFDNGYNKTIELRFSPGSSGPTSKPYSLGEISLNDSHKDENGRFACYVNFKH